MAAKSRFPPAEQPRLPAVLTEVEHLEFDSETSIEGIMAKGFAVETSADYVEITGSVLHGLAFTGLTFENLSMVDVIVEDSEYSGVTFDETSFLRSQFRTSRLSGLNAPSLRARDVTFVGCKLNGANFRMSSWERCMFLDCDLQDAEFTSATFSTTQFRNCRMERAEFLHARVESLSLHGSVLDGISGAESLRGAVIGSDQVLVLAGAVFTALGIEINDDAI